MSDSSSETATVEPDPVADEINTTTAPAPDIVPATNAARTEPLQQLQAEPRSTERSGDAEINLDLLMDVQVTLSVEIGRARLPIKDLISLSQGSVIELDRAVNEPLDLMVNGTLIARGEVVVADGDFGLRLIDVVSPAERLKKLK